MRRYRAKKRALIEQNTPLPINLPKVNFTEEMDEIKVDFFPLGIYPAQQKFLDLLTNRRFVLLRAGRQLGKSRVGMAAMCRQIYERPAPMGVGWIISPTYPMAEQLRHKIEEVCAPLIVDKREGNTPFYLFEPRPGTSKPYRVEVRTADNPERLRGPTLDWVWMDEASSMDRKVWPILLPTVAVSRGPIFATTTPAGKNWVWEQYTRPAEAGDANYGEVVAKSSEAKHFTDDDIRLMRRNISADMARQELDAEIVSFDGLVYPQFLNEVHVIDPLEELPKGSVLVGGIDWGWKDPFVHLTVVKDGGRFILVDEYYKSGTFMEDHVKAIKARSYSTMVGRRWADPSRPEYIAELSIKGIGAYPANNDIKLGIDCVKRLLEQRKLFVTRNCVETIREFNQYHYSDKTDRNTRDVPVDAWNHSMDALRYICFNEDSFQVQNKFAVEQEDGSYREYGVKMGDVVGVDEAIELEGFSDDGAL